MHAEVCEAWEKRAWQTMWEAAAEESEMAIGYGSVHKNGTPTITVVCDGSWANRSYRGGGNYNSLSGVAAIVGLKTVKKIIFGSEEQILLCARGVRIKVKQYLLILAIKIGTVRLLAWNQL
ncbi:unnamed protein product [Phaedon cochleariae]|uniref:Mutator-like transposase domain-containing protein n=1 Tax=Phaedon cochleariae TaxID=80249 RepID=A0A9N9SN07_PHACE|nr:unnamed protein product [Phaedon cochleariae]